MHRRKFTHCHRAFLMLLLICLLKLTLRPDKKYFYEFLLLSHKENCENVSLILCQSPKSCVVSKEPTFTAF